MYLQIPEDKITESTRNLVKDIVKETRRDIEKALAIEKYLETIINTIWVWKST